jgi:hypothetical protein
MKISESIEEKKKIDKKIAEYFCSLVGDSSLASRCPVIIEDSVEDKEKISKYLMRAFENKAREFSCDGHSLDEMQFLVSSIVENSASLIKNLPDESLEFHFSQLFQWYKSKEEFLRAQGVSKKLTEHFFMKGKLLMSNNDFKKAEKCFMLSKENYEKVLSLYQNIVDGEPNKKEIQELKKRKDDVFLLQKICKMYSSKNHFKRLRVFFLRVYFGVRGISGALWFYIVLFCICYLCLVVFYTWKVGEQKSEPFFNLLQRVFLSNVSLAVHSVFWGAVLSVLLSRYHKD